MGVSELYRLHMLCISYDLGILVYCLTIISLK